MSSAPAVTDSSFDKDVLQSDLPVLVDFGHHGAAHVGWSLRL